MSSNNPDTTTDPPASGSDETGVKPEITIHDEDGTEIPIDEFDPDNYLNDCPTSEDIDGVEDLGLKLKTETELRTLRPVLESFSGPLYDILGHGADNAVSSMISPGFFIPAHYQQPQLAEEDEEATVEIRLELREGGNILDVSILDYGPGITLTDMLLMFYAGQSRGNGVFNRHGIGLKIMLMVVERALRDAGYSTANQSELDRGNAFQIVSKRPDGDVFRVRGPVDDLTGPQRASQDLWEDLAANHYIEGGESGTIVQISIPHSRADCGAEKVRTTVDHLREHLSLRYAPLLLRDEQRGWTETEPRPGNPTNPRGVSIWMSWEDHHYQAEFPDKDTSDFNGTTHAGATRLEPFLPELASGMVDWNDTVGSLPFNSDWRTIEVTTEETDEFIGRYLMKWKIGVESIPGTIEKHATVAQGGRAEYENGVKLLHGESDPTIRNYFKAGDPDTILIAIGGQIVEVDGAQYLFDDIDTSHPSYNYLSGIVHLIPIDEVSPEELPERVSRDGIQPDAPLFSKAREILSEEVNISVLKHKKARELATGEQSADPDSKFHSYLEQEWKRREYKPFCKIGYYKSDSIDTDEPLPIGEVDILAHLTDDPQELDEMPTDGDIDLVEMKTCHIDSDTIGNRCWKYVVANELANRTTNRFLIYTTGIKNKADVDSAVQKLEQDYDITVEVHSLGNLFDDADDLQETLDAYDKTLDDVDDLTTLFSDDPDKTEKQFL